MVHGLSVRQQPALAAGETPVRGVSRVRLGGARPRAPHGPSRGIFGGVAVASRIQPTPRIIQASLSPPSSAMDASSNELRTSILDWDENDVHNWLSKLGFPQYEQQVKGVCVLLFVSSIRTVAHGIPEHNISGDVLCLLDPESLKEMGISTIGQRLTILKAVYNVKLAQNIPIEPEHYVPPCTFSLPHPRSFLTSSAAEAEERQEVSVGRLYDLLKDQSTRPSSHILDRLICSTGERLRSLEDDNRRLSDTLSSCLEDLGQLRGISARPQLVSAVIVSG